MIIHLGPLLPVGSSGTTRRTSASHTVYVAIERLPIRPCFCWGLPSHEVTLMLVSSYLTVSPFPAPVTRQVVFFSVALSADRSAPPLTANTLFEVPTFLWGASSLAIIRSTPSYLSRLTPAHGARSVFYCILDTLPHLPERSVLAPADLPS